MQIRSNLGKLSKKTVLRTGDSRGSRNTSSGNFEFFSMGASYLNYSFKLNATKFAQIG